ncbi:MAG: hypothetical protein AYK23_05695 [Candidatus Proteinoplasmatales archaeon SG8-5]|nr:MAG: hypothetical protein AYK23_05695 [Candidatus Proteinoplasmatales archaeon SG8-5]
MELEIQDKKENPLLERTEVEFVIKHPNQPTPKRENVREQLSKELKVPKDRIVVDHMNSRFGLATSTGYAKIYDKKETALEIERKHHLLRNRLVKDEKAKKEVPEETEAPAKEEAEATADEKAEEQSKEEKPDKKEKKADKEPEEDKKEE